MKLVSTEQLMAEVEGEQGKQKKTASSEKKNKASLKPKDKSVYGWWSKDVTEFSTQKNLSFRVLEVD